MLVSKNPSYLARGKHLSTTAKKNSLTYFHDEVGYNYRLVNVLAAIGVAQLEQLDSFIVSKIKTASYYREHLRDVGDIEFQESSSDVVSNEWLFTITTESMQPLLEYLNDNGVMSRPFWVPMNQLPMYKKCLYINKSDVSALIHKNSLSIPCSTGISESQLGLVVEKIKAFFD